MAGAHVFDGPGTSGCVRLLVVDRHPVVRRGIEACLGRHHRMCVVAEGSDVEEAIERGRSRRPHVALLDAVSIPDATRKLKGALPHTDVVVFTMDDRSSRVRQAVRSGVRGYVLKTASPEELVEAIETIHRGSRYFSPQVSEMLLNGFVSDAGTGRNLTQLTVRENAVLKLIAEGSTSREIGERLRISVRTVDSHRRKIMRKLDVHTVAGLTRLAVAHGITEPE